MFKRNLIFLASTIFLACEGVFAFDPAIFPYQVPSLIHATREPKKLHAGMEYRSKYYWRGQWFYGASAGIFLPYLSYSEEDKLFYVGGEIGENLLFDETQANESGFGEVEKDWVGLDFGASFNREFLEGKVKGSLGFWYYWYFKSKDIGNDDVDNSFAELNASATLVEVFLSPTLTYSHYHRVDPDYSKRTNEDYYITLSGSYPITLKETGGTFTFLGDISYWHYASQEESPLYGEEGEIPSGISDATLAASFSFTSGVMTYQAGLHYAYVFDDKFDYTEGSEFDQNKFWSTMSVDYNF